MKSISAVFSLYISFASSSKSICHHQQQFCFHTTFNALVILAQSAHRGSSPSGSPTQQRGDCRCLMFQTGALGRTGGSIRPSATGHLTLLFNSQLFFFLSSKRIKIHWGGVVWKCLCSTVSAPPENFFCSFDPQTGPCQAGPLCLNRSWSFDPSQLTQVSTCSHSNNGRGHHNHRLGAAEHHQCC